jgi:segregation and condensation protein B
MRPHLSVGQLLHSASARYGHPCATGVRRTGWSPLPARRQGPIGEEKPHASGVSSTRDPRLTRLEAVFFLSQQPQSSRKLAQLAGLADGTKARTLVRTLNRTYDARASAFRVEEVAGGFQLMTRPKFAPWLRRLHSAQAEIRLSAPAMETLAVVAYRQPVLRVEIEAIRGVQSGEVLRQLIERDLVRIAGRSDELGRPFLYATTRQFLQIFGLRHLDELPRADILRKSRPSAIAPSDVSGDLDTQITSSSNPSQVAEEETNVKTLITPTPRQNALAGDRAALVQCPHDQPIDDPIALAKRDEDADEDDVEDEDETDDEDLDDEPWEEVEDDEELDEEEDEEWDEDEDWEDEDWDDDEDDDWDDDEEEEEEKPE